MAQPEKRLCAAGVIRVHYYLTLILLLIRPVVSAFL